MHAQTQPSPAALAADARRAGRRERAADAGHLQAVREQARLQAEDIRQRKEWIEARRRELWERRDRLKTELGIGAPPVADARDHLAASGLIFPPTPAPPGAVPLLAAPGDPSAAGPACRDDVLARAQAEQVRLETEVSGSEMQLERQQVEEESEAERQWLRDEVSRMREDGWSWEELAGIGFGRDLLARLGIEPAAEPRPVDLTDVKLDSRAGGDPSSGEEPPVVETGQAR